MELLNVSIDRLTFLGAADHEMIQGLAHNPFVSRQRVAEYPYRYQWHMMDGSVLQLADKNAGIPEIRFEFNPNNWDSPYKRDANIMSIMRCIINPKLSRIDIAMDIKGYDFGQATITDTKSRKEALYKGRDKSIETYYYGTRRSPVFIRIYNKAREQGLKHYSDNDWWRAEAQINGDLAEEFHVINPFEELHITRPSPLDDYGIQTRAMLEYLRNHPEAIHELSKNVKTKYKELLLATAEHEEIRLSQLYEQKKEHLRQEVNMWKNLTQTMQTVCPKEIDETLPSMYTSFEEIKTKYSNNS